MFATGKDTTDAMVLSLPVPAGSTHPEKMQSIVSVRRNFAGAELGLIATIKTSEEPKMDTKQLFKLNYLFCMGLPLG